MRQASLWHNSEYVHANGSIIAPGGYGNGIIGFGDESTSYPSGKSHFYRENLLEFVRVTRSDAPVSRFNCAFAFESRDQALLLARLTNKGCYEVLPPNPHAPMGRHEMGWIDWSGAPGRTPTEVVHAIERYWRGEAAPKTDLNGWEWLSSSGLQVVARIARVFAARGMPSFCHGTVRSGGRSTNVGFCPKVAPCARETSRAAHEGPSASPLGTAPL